MEGVKGRPLLLPSPARLAFLVLISLAIVFGTLSIPAFSPEETAAAETTDGGDAYVPGCILGGEICLAREDTGDGNIFSALGATLLNIFNFFKGIFEQVTASGRSWDNLPAQIPKPGAEKFLEAYGVSTEEFAGTCSNPETPAVDWFLVAFGSVAAKTFLRVDAFGSLPEEALYVANGILALTIVMVLLLVFFFLEMPGYSVSHEIVSGSPVGKMMKDVLVSIFPNVEITDLLNAPEEDPAQQDVSWGKKAVRKVGRFFDNVTTPWETKALLGAAGSEGEKDGEDSFGRDMSKEAVLFVARDLASAFSIVAIKGGMIIAIILALFYGLMQLQVPGIATACNLLVFKIYLATFWAFWIWQIIVYTVKSLAFVFAALLPRPVVAWLLVPFTGGPIPILDIILRLVFRVLGILYIVSLAKPLNPAVDLGQLGLAAFAAMLFYLLMIITSIGVKVLITVWRAPFDLVLSAFSALIDLGAENTRKRMTKSPGPSGTQKESANKWRTKNMQQTAATAAVKPISRMPAQATQMAMRNAPGGAGKVASVAVGAAQQQATKQPPKPPASQESTAAMYGGGTQPGGE